MSFGDTLQSWHDFYLTVGAAAATLVGLLFVGLSLHIRVVVSHSDVKGVARITLIDFFVALLVSLLILAPAGDSRTTSASLIAVSAISLWLVVRPVAQGITTRRTRTLGLRVLIPRFGLSALCYLGVGAVGVLFGRGEVADALNGLLFVVIILLVVAVRNAWDLLVSVADWSEADHIRDAEVHPPET